MLFNSLEFILFFIVVSVSFFLTPSKWRWLFLLIASYFFYMCWKMEYALLIIGSTVFTFYVTAWMEKQKEKKKRTIALVSILICNLGILFLFKYFNFFSGAFNDILGIFSSTGSQVTLRLLLPVGISFYTFQIIGYSLDVYWERHKSEKHLGVFALYVVFFPQLVAGPIERSSQLIPQFYEKKTFQPDNIVVGLKIMIWGFFKKLVIADKIAAFVDPIFTSPDEFNALWTIVAVLLFAIQIFCDFSGYTDIAIGTARVMGFTLMQNFNRPYFAKSITEFWRRWHISLSQWINDYLYTPIVLGKREWGRNGILYALVVTFTLVGFWHGAEWTFVFFGLSHGLIMAFEVISKKQRKKIYKKLPNWPISLITTLLTFLFWCLSLILFRSSNLSDAFTTYKKLFSSDFGNAAALRTALPMFTIACGILMLGIQLLKEINIDLDNRISRMPWIMQGLFYITIITLIGFYGAYHGNQEFIYFQF